ncbi:PCRF domain-containing protein [Pseudobacteroides cellulosolvens]|uniref:PCRF domain protein n=1 Tax=Pseudobacteroides cellulosolvens ATCC 35603 = DSM 2933 TaxID=398512 RepID=A0A0L6JMC1_9FIRM|nr:PCRF domain-containing protein [Pseudobacteroides cellulosolvens]KNY26903.1 PCRF domain protein [Pseudobacteroides cellulosolvens ATCC 35603 = DSM 2933]
MLEIIQLKENIDNYKELLNDLKSLLDLPKIESEINTIEQQVSETGFWTNTKNPKKVMKRLTYLKEKVEKYDQLEKAWSDLKNLCDLAIEEKDVSVLDDILKTFDSFKKDLDKLRLEAILSADGFGTNNAIITIHSDNKDEQTQEYLKMLFNMYSKWGEENKFTVQMFSESIHELVFGVIGKYAYGYLKGEKGVHQFTDISKLTNELCNYEILVDVVPELEDSEEVYVKPENYLINCYLTKDKEGRHRDVSQVVHVPTGINIWLGSGSGATMREKKSSAIKIINSKLLDMMRYAKLESIEDLIEIPVNEALMNKRRSYIFYPNEMVQDHRTNIESDSLKGVLQGEIDGMLSLT